MNWVKVSFYSVEYGDYKVSKNFVEGAYRYILYEKDGNRWKLADADYFETMAELEKSIQGA